MSLLDPAVLADPYGVYGALRQQPPVLVEGLGMYLVSRYEDVLATVRDTERFSSRFGGSSNAFGAEIDEEIAAVEAQGYERVDTLLTNDPPDHTRFRNLVNKAFTPRRVGQMEGEIRGVAEALVDTWIDDGRVELVGQFAVGLPLTVIADAIGVDRADMPLFKEWSDDFVAPLSGLQSREGRLKTARSTVAFGRYMTERIEERRAEPRDDLLSDLVQARLEGGDRLAVHELLGVLQQLLVAGNETTTKTIASTMLALLQHPEQMAMVRKDPSLVPNLVEEGLRYEAPVQMLFRIAKVDAEVGGTLIPAGARCLVMYGSANRDDARFPSGGAFDVTRDNARAHLAFGQGPHFCVGAALARSEARIAYETLLDRLDDIALDTSVEVPWERELSMVLRGLTSLHLTFTKRR